MPGQELLGRAASVGWVGVPEQHDCALDLAQQTCQEGHDLGAPDIVGVELKVQAQAVPDRADRERGQGRKALAAIAVA